jgi:hypothetical protein
VPDWLSYKPPFEVKQEASLPRGTLNRVYLRGFLSSCILAAYRKENISQCKMSASVLIKLSEHPEWVCNA